VFFRIIMLDIEKEKVEEGGKPLKNVRADAAGGLDGGMDAFLFKEEDQRLGKVRRCHTFSSGDGDAAPGLFVKIHVLKAHFGDFFYCFIFPLAGKGPAGAAFYAGEAAAAFMKVNADPSVFSCGHGLLRTDLHATAAVQAAVAVIKDLYAGQLGLRIGTPSAAEGAAL
jgi:hypothetical protein